MNHKFEYIEDKKYFDNHFEEYGGIVENMQFFDFREPSEKRKEFNKIRGSIFKKLHTLYGNLCQLKLHNDCTNQGDVIDHFIPLSSNKLNKQLRNIPAERGKKVKTQSFGSNNFSNFILACRRCNAHKQNKFPSQQLMKNHFDNLFLRK